MAHLISKRSDYAVLDFMGWEKSGQLEISPRFQRRGVWSPSAKSYFLDTILQGFPVPPIYIRVRQNESRTQIVREVVDGQQRIRSVLDFVSDRYRLSRNLESPYANKSFSKLPSPQQDDILKYAFSCEVFQGTSDEEILALFARLNTHAVPLTKQELRNGKYFGLFKQSVYKLAHEHLGFWRRHGVFSERQIARMQEAELVSELLALAISGVQDKKKSLDRFYADYDDEFEGRAQYETRFRTTIDALGEVFATDLRESEFRRRPLFYSLYAAVYHYMFGVPGLPTSGGGSGRLSAEAKLKLRGAEMKLSEVLRAQREEGVTRKGYQSFIEASLRQTDNRKPRETVIRTLHRMAFID